MENKLISMVDFVLEQNSKWSSAGALRNIVKYATFLKQPLKLGFFVPCDENGNVSEEPIQIEFQESTILEFQNNLEKYQQAKDRVLFEGFDKHQAKLTCELYSKIEDLINFNLTLTASAIKQFNI